MTTKKQALIIIDVQNDYFDKGLNPLHNAQYALDKTKEVLQVYRDKKLPVIHIQHVSLSPNAPFFIPETKGVRIHSELTPLMSEMVIRKHSANSFCNTELDKLLTQMHVEELVVCGMMSHHCVDTTVRSAKDHGYDVVLIQDACATKALTFNNEVISAETVQKVFMASLQGFAKVIKAEEIDRM